MHDQLSALLSYLESNYFVQQIAPLLALLLIPAFVLFTRVHWQTLAWLVDMVLEALALALPWNWSAAGADDDGASSPERRRARKKKHVRMRSGQVAATDSSIELDSLERTKDDEADLYYPGLVNISGTYCFLNSVMQALASLAYLQPHLEAIYAKAVELDVPTPVVDALRETLIALNTPRRQKSSLRPETIINTLSAPGSGKRSKLFSSREHQDAQELFQLVSECVKNESVAVDKEGQRDRGLGGLDDNPAKHNAEVGTSVFDGLTANRRSCVECGYTEAVMHFAFDNWQLSLPRASACTLQECLADYTRLELLTDCICQKCSMLATHRRLIQEAEKLGQAVANGSSATSSKKRRARDARRMETRVRQLIADGRIEENIRGLKMEKVLSRESTKQAMIARPPRVLVLHLNRSVHYGSYAGRNSCRVVFPEVLDLTPYTTSGQLSTVPSVPISSPQPSIPRSTTPTQSIFANPRILYRLSAVVCHYGQHSFGHYVCFRRKPPTRPDPGPSTLSPPKLACPYGCECRECMAYGHVRDARPPAPGCGWLRISDATVSEVGLERVLAEGVGAFMLFYERAVHPRPAIYLQHTPRSSEETVRPELVNGNAHLNGSTLSLPDDGKLGVSMMSGWTGSSAGSSVASVRELEEEAEKALLPRVVRRATAGRSRSASAAPSELGQYVRTPPVPSPPANGSADPTTGHAGGEEAQADAVSTEAVKGKSTSPVGNGDIVPSPQAQSRKRNSPTKDKQPPLHPAPDRISSTSLSSSVSPPASPSPSPSPAPAIRASHSQTRIKSPQPIRAHLSSGMLSPLGLRA